MGVVNTIRVSFTLFHIVDSLHSEPQWVIVDVCFVCFCASQRAGAAKEELSHRHRQEEAGGRVCRAYSHSHATTQLFVVRGASLIIVSGFRSPHFV